MSIFAQNFGAIFRSFSGSRSPFYPSLLEEIAKFFQRKFPPSLYRSDSRSLDEILKKGFQPRKEYRFGVNTIEDLENYLEDPQSVDGLVSTTSSLASALRFPTGKWVFVIETRKLPDTVLILDIKQIFDGHAGSDVRAIEQEMAIIGGIPASAICMAINKVTGEVLIPEWADPGYELPHFPEEQ